MDEIVTYLMEIYSPDSGLYEGLAPQEKQPIINAFTALMNNHAKNGKYYAELHIFLWCCLKYNLGALRVEWHRQRGIALQNTPQGSVERVEQILWQANLLKALDMYNVIWDISVLPKDVCRKGEFASEIDAVTKFRVVKMAENGELFNIERYLDTTVSEELSFYETHPEIRGNDTHSTHGSGTVDWVKYWTGSSGDSENTAAIELIYYYGWLRGKDWGLSDNDDLSIWRITVANGKYITEVSEQNNAHGMLPICFAMSVLDNMGLQQRSACETLAPFQDFGSFLMNVNVKSDRKSLYGITVYNPNLVDMSQIPKDDVAARIPLGASAGNIPVRDAVEQFTDAPDTAGTLEKLALNMELMEKLYPADMLQNVTDLERATQFQAAATVHGSNRRSHKNAKLINDQAITDARTMMVYNILEFQEPLELPMPNGEKIEVNPTEFREMGVEHFIGEGLQSLDRMAVWLQLKDVINSLLQSPQANAEVDMLGLISYFASVGGLNVDLTQFRRVPRDPNNPNPDVNVDLEAQVPTQ